MKKIFIITLTFFTILGASANDVANFVNLGFSPDSNYFMFSEYGQNLKKGQVYANAYIVDVKNNKFVPHGKKTQNSDYIISAGQSGAGAVYNLVRKWNITISKYKIDNLNTGRIIYLLDKGQSPKSQISYRDFESGNTYTIELNQLQFEEKNKIESSFFLSVEINKKNSTDPISKIAGLPNYRRKNVSQYFIKQIILSPDSQNLIFVIGKKIRTPEGQIDIRYMVETLVI